MSHAQSAQPRTGSGRTGPYDANSPKSGAVVSNKLHWCACKRENALNERPQRDRVDRGDLEPGDGLFEGEPRLRALLRREALASFPADTQAVGFRARVRERSPTSRRARSAAPLAQASVIFMNSMSDLFHERVPLSFVQDVFLDGSGRYAARGARRGPASPVVALLAFPPRRGDASSAP